MSPLLPRRVFIKDFLKAGRPVLFSDATDRWRARSRWTFEWFRDRFGDLPTQALAYAPGKAVSYTQRSRRCAIREIVEGEVSGTPTSDGQYLYIAEKLTRLPSELLADFEFPGYTQLRRLSITNLWLGPAGTFTDCHFDYGHNLFAQLVGRKRIQLWPFGTTFPSPAVPEGSLVAHVSEDGWPSDFGSPPVRPAFEIVIEPGEMLFIPYRCFHRILGLEPSISINHFWYTLNVFAARADHRELVRSRARPKVAFSRPARPPCLAQPDRP